MLRIAPFTGPENGDCVPLTPSFKRQDWLDRVVEALRTKFNAAGYSIPDKIRFAIGWPKSSAGCAASGECWSPKASSDEHSEIFISPELTNGAAIIAILAHELVHAAVGVEAGHKGLFKQCALKVGLVGPMRATTAGVEFLTWTDGLLARIGDYFSGFLTDTPKQTTRLRKCACPVCGYAARVTRKWLALAGPPICPIDRIAMAEEEGAP
jgi:hypothetical protein